MQQQPIRVVVSRDGSDADHEAMHNVHAVILQNPHVGDATKMYFDNGRYLVTSTVKRVAQADDEMVVETANSTYRLRVDTN